MSQTFTDDCFAAGHVAQTDLANMEANFATLKSTNSGGSAPANQVAGMLWFDTTKKVQKQRNQGDSAWIGLMHGDVSQKVWVYRNAAMDGWAIDGTVTDKVLALKGGATYTAGAATAGSWTLSGFTSGTESADHTHGVSITSGAPSATVNIPDGAGGTPQFPGSQTHTHAVSGNTGVKSATHTHTVSHDGTSRVAAAVGTLQYLDL